jgi:hypothetical protein
MNKPMRKTVRLYLTISASEVCKGPDRVHLRKVPGHQEIDLVFEADVDRFGMTREAVDDALRSLRDRVATVAQGAWRSVLTEDEKKRVEMEIRAEELRDRMNGLMNELDEIERGLAGRVGR